MQLLTNYDSSQRRSEDSLDLAGSLYLIPLRFLGVHYPIPDAVTRKDGIVDEFPLMRVRANKLRNKQSY